MNDYIKRSDIRDAVENTDWYHIGVKGNLVHGANSDLHEPLFKADDIFNAIEAVLPADVRKNVRGEWIHDTILSDESGTGYFLMPDCTCSICGLLSMAETNFCPNCGAKMEEET